VPQLFDKADWAAERAQLQQVLSEREYAAASRTTTNAYYTDAALVKEIRSPICCCCASASRAGSLPTRIGKLSGPSSSMAAT
jgi:hypothetical protein